MLDFRVIYVTRFTYVIIYVTGVTYMICYKYDPTEHQDTGMGNKMLHRENLALIGQVVSEKKIFEKCVWSTDRPRSRDDLDLN